VRQNIDTLLFFHYAFVALIIRTWFDKPNECAW